MSSCPKVATVMPLFKMSDLDKKDKKNYRLIDYFPFISKLIQKVVAHTKNTNKQQHNLQDS